MFFKRKNKLKHMVINADNAKKVNPLDLSADQDLTIAIMNLIELEKLLGKIGKTDGYDMGGAIRDMRHRLMGRVVSDKDSELWDMSLYLLGSATDLMERGFKESGAGAYELFDKAYEVYSLFWGGKYGVGNGFRCCTRNWQMKNKKCANLLLRYMGKK